MHNKNKALPNLKVDFPPLEGPQYPDVEATYALVLGVDETRILSFRDEAYEQIESVLSDYGFAKFDESLYVFKPGHLSSPVQGVLAIQALEENLWWFRRDTLKKAYLVRIDEADDLLKVLE